MTLDVRYDCREFKGDFPCRHRRPCTGCSTYDPIRRRVLIVMLIKLGDMLIASALPKALKEQEPGTYISWLADKSCAPVLKLNPWIDEVIEYNWESVSALSRCSFDLILGFERERAAAALVDQIRSKEKRGLAFGGEHNTLYALCESGQYFFKLNTWNDFRTRINNKSWTEFYFELAGLKYADEPYQLATPASDIDSAEKIIGMLPQSHRSYIIFNFGGSFTYKIWPADKWIELIHIVSAWKYGIVITFGPAERSMVEQVLEALPSNLKDVILIPDTSHSVGLLAAIYQSAVAIVTGDTFGMHLGLWAKKPTVALFGPSNPAEVIPKSTHNIRVIRTNYLCSPCAHQVTCDGIGGCMGDISVDRVTLDLKAALPSRSQPVAS
jgi:ADP-heptose:LPS heptosyltransferase